MDDRWGSDRVQSILREADIPSRWRPLKRWVALADLRERVEEAVFLDLLDQGFGFKDAFLISRAH